MHWQHVDVRECDTPSCGWEIHCSCWVPFLYVWNIALKTGEKCPDPMVILTISWKIILELKKLNKNHHFQTLFWIPSKPAPFTAGALTLLVASGIHHPIPLIFLKILQATQLVKKKNKDQGRKRSIEKRKSTAIPKIEQSWNLTIINSAPFLLLWHVLGAGTLGTLKQLANRGIFHQKWGFPWRYPNSWMLSKGNFQSKMDETERYPHDYGTPIW